MQDKRLCLLQLQMSINTGHNTLGGCFFITGSTINLAGQEKILYYLGLQGIVQILRIKIIIFYRISRLEYHGIFQALNSVQGFQLNLKR